MSIFLLHSCQKDNLPKNRSNLSIREAQELVNKRLQQLYPSPDIQVRDAVFPDFDILWDSAASYHSTNKAVDVVEAKIIEGPISIPIYKVGSTMDTSNFLAHVAERRIIVTRNSANDFSIFVLKIVPDPQTVISSTEVATTNFDHYAPDFEGLIQFSSLLDSTYRTYQIKNDSEYIFIPSTQTPFHSASLETRDVVCDYVDVYTYVCCCAFTEGYDYSCEWVYSRVFGCFDGGGGLSGDDEYNGYQPGQGSGENSGGGGGASGSNQTNYYDLLIEKFFDNPAELRALNRLARHILDLYGINMTVNDFWNIMGDAYDPFTDANLDWQAPNGQINEIHYFEDAFAELIFLSDIAYPLDTLNYTQTKAYKWLKNQPDKFNFIKNKVKNFSDNHFTIRAVDYFLYNPNTTTHQFENWFMTSRLGKDFEYDAAFWENPNLSIPHQSLPTWANYAYNYPATYDKILIEQIGGEVKHLKLYEQDRFNNYCVLKASYALAYSGINIPSIITILRKFFQLDIFNR